MSQTGIVSTYKHACTQKLFLSQILYSLVRNADINKSIYLYKNLKIQIKKKIRKILKKFLKIGKFLDIILKIISK